MLLVSYRVHVRLPCLRAQAVLPFLRAHIALPSLREGAVLCLYLNPPWAHAALACLNADVQIAFSCPKAPAAFPSLRTCVAS
jgi:hypothetical protein